MANYREENVQGTSYVRCRNVTISNPLDGVSTAQFLEERCVLVGDSAIATTPAGVVETDFNPAESIPLRNPETGELTGTSISQLDLYVILYSLYIQKALERDAQAT